ncbi:hypothetical protein GOP47_0008385 [Adiantum capillus-veneris]|uniref:Secreted protein n=1 Tax=Adiantum capillus-veneris TaxID=13818 RepID=A0A9D4UY69_ADICA|nr:hypothetical protein GOP47_0008385 [Adiantum capillus-veneris]
MLLLLLIGCLLLLSNWSCTCGRRLAGDTASEQSNGVQPRVLDYAVYGDSWPPEATSARPGPINNIKKPTPALSP